MRTILGTILVATLSMSVSASPLSESPARTTPDWFRKGVMYQIQPRAFTPEGTIKAAEAKLGWLADTGVTVVYMCPVTAADDDPRQDMWSPRQVKLRRDNAAMTSAGETWLDNDKPESVLSLRRGETAASGVVFVGNFSGKEVTVNVASVAADKTRILLSNGAEVDGGLFRLAPWGFAFVGDVSVEGD